VAYTPEWGPIGDALKRLVASGMSKSEAKRDLCGAIADGAITIRARVAADRYRCLPASVISGADISLPPDLSPKDIDWQRSRPWQSWTTAQRQPGEWVMTFISRAGHLVDRKIDLIEVRRTDVTKVLFAFGAGAIPDPTVNPANPPKRKSGAGAKSRAVIQAIEQLWRGGIPPGLSAKDRNKRIVEWLREANLSVPANPERAIQRALAQLQSRQLAP
jgi:hypothetical protein